MYHSNATVQNIFKTFENYRDISFLMRELHKVLTISTLKLIKILVKYRGVTVTAKILLNALRKQKINNRTAASKYINATNRMKRVNFGRKSLNIIYIIINTPNCHEYSLWILYNCLFYLKTTPQSTGMKAPVEEP